MNTMRLLKLAPTVIMAVVMAYSAYSINPRRQPSPCPLQPLTHRPEGEPARAGRESGQGRDVYRVEAGSKSLRGAGKVRPGEQDRGWSRHRPGSQGGPLPCPRPGANLERDLRSRQDPVRIDQWTDSMSGDST